MDEEKTPTGPDREEIEAAAEEAMEAAQEAREAADEARHAAREQARAAMARIRERTAAQRQMIGNLGSAIKGTAGDMLREGRRGASQAQDEMWARYEAKTKHRRSHPPRVDD